jgi:hypothetical protein
MDDESLIPRADLLAMISDQIPEVYPDYGMKKTEALAVRVLEDLYILALRCRVPSWLSASASYSGTSGAPQVLVQ